ncbi:hypothetical protein Tco_0725687 [Tanacetum coccineum]|uniref:Uncharacterized protein n=1 Tax=Tanacetum coccineum TaxID=301880 RepID=A0ABQ4YEG4_9ASTR
MDVLCMKFCTTLHEIAMADWRIHNATYCASVEDIAVQYCFFDILLTSLSPRNCIPPEVLLRVSMHSACSTSENALEKPLDILYIWINSSNRLLGLASIRIKSFPQKVDLFMMFRIKEPSRPADAKYTFSLQWTFRNYHFKLPSRYMKGLVAT